MVRLRRASTHFQNAMCASGLRIPACMRMKSPRPACSAEQTYNPQAQHTAQSARAVPTAVPSIGMMRWNIIKTLATRPRATRLTTDTNLQYEIRDAGAFGPTCKPWHSTSGKACRGRSRTGRYHRTTARGDHTPTPHPTHTRRPRPNMHVWYRPNTQLPSTPK